MTTSPLSLSGIQPRDTHGRFSEKSGSAPEVGLDTPPSPLEAKNFTEFRERFHNLPTLEEKVTVVEERWDAWSRRERIQNLEKVTNIASLSPNSPRVLDEIFTGEYGPKADAALVANDYLAAGARYKLLLSYRAKEADTQEEADDRERVLHAAAWSLKSPRHRMVLDMLATDTDARVRAAVALNRHTSPATLEKLARDPDVIVREHAVYNDSTPAAAKVHTALSVDVPQEDYAQLKHAFLDRHRPLDEAV
jgi:hypothetical protein